MTQRIRLIRSLQVGLCLQALTGGTSASANLFLCCRSGPTVAGAISQVPPIQGGLARVWFLRQFEPGESLATTLLHGSIVWRRGVDGIGGRARS